MIRRTPALATVGLSLLMAACSNSSTPAAAPSAAASTAAATTAAPTATPKYPDQPNAAAATAPCDGKITSDPAVAAKLPKGFPVLTGWTGTSSVTQGKTTAIHGVVKATPAQISTLRDTVFTQIKNAGYKVTGSDQEPGFEADGDFSGPNPGNINVKLLCQDYLLVTYTFGG